MWKAWLNFLTPYKKGVNSKFLTPLSADKITEKFLDTAWQNSLKQVSYFSLYYGKKKNYLNAKRKEDNMKEKLSHTLSVRISDATLSQLQMKCKSNISTLVRNLIDDYLKGEMNNEHSTESKDNKSE